MGFDQSPIEWVPGVPSPVVMRQGRDNDYCTAEVKNKWTCNTPSPYAFIARTGSTVLLAFIKTMFI